MATNADEIVWFRGIGGGTFAYIGSEKQVKVVRLAGTGSFLVQVCRDGMPFKQGEDGHLETYHVYEADAIAHAEKLAGVA